jgi:hypothetical protein
VPSVRKSVRRGEPTGPDRARMIRHPWSLPCRPRRTLATTEPGATSIDTSSTSWWRHGIQDDYQGAEAGCFRRN